MTDPLDDELIVTVQRLFTDRGFSPTSIKLRAFPDETIVVVELQGDAVSDALKVSTDIEKELPPSFLLVIRKADIAASANRSTVTSVNDNRVSRLIELLNERSRTSEHQPSLHYIKDAAENLRVVLTRRHHIIFGRRGVGKTALLLEAKRQIERSGALNLWINVQVLRGLDGRRAFLTVVQRLCELPKLGHRARITPPASVRIGDEINDSVRRLLAKSKVLPQQVADIVPRVQQFIALFCAEQAIDLFIFVDDLHYLELNEQPVFLDLLHGVTRDNPAWLKVAGIRNQCRSFSENPPTGLQSGHDAAEISLDVTLEEPKKASEFLHSVIKTYLNAASISNSGGFLSNAAMDRLVLASGGVPRDFLVLGARSIQIARLRSNARVVGVQDVNEAAGEAGKQKKAELEEDAAASSGQSARHLVALERVRGFTIDENHCSFFKINLRDKNTRSDEYRLLQSLMDLRMIHLIKASLSDAHAAGERSEVYMIDLSEFSGSRLKKNLNVIELRGNALVLRTTGKDGKTIVANTPRRVVQILRNGPLFSLSMLSKI
jgi:hypothetical protein